MRIKIICSEYINNPKFIFKASEIFGSQCIVLGVDIRRFDNDYYAHINLGKEKVNQNIEDYISRAEDMGVGEFFINNIDRDGMMNGYDINLINKISTITSLPIISSGGAGNFEHIFELFLNTNCSAAACSSIFHFGDNNPIRAASYLRNKGIEMKKIK